MQELSMNVLDIAENSVAAGASLIEITLDIDTGKKRLAIVISDNGKGMPPEMLETVTDPFTTSRTTRKIGMGLPLLKMAAEQTGGSIDIQSVQGSGTVVRTSFTLGHIDLMPVGDIASTIAALIQCNPDIDFVFSARADEMSFTADTREMRVILGEDASFDIPEVALWLNGYLEENTREIVKRSIVL
jgi:hypothetical protein